MNKIKNSLLTLGSVAAVAAPVAGVVSCGSDSIDVSKSIVVYADIKGNNKAGQTLIYNALKKQFDIDKKGTAYENINIVVKYGKIEEVNTKAEETWGQYSEHTPDVIMAGLDHKDNLKKWAKEFTDAEVANMTGVTNKDSLVTSTVEKQDGAIAFNDEADKNFALKFDGQLPYQYLKFGTGLLTGIAAPTDQKVMSYYVKVMNKRMAGFDVDGATTSGFALADNGITDEHTVDAKIYGKAVVLSDTNTITGTPFAGMAVEPMSGTYMHFAQLGWQAPMYQAYMNALNGNEISGTPATRAALATASKTVYDAMMTRMADASNSAAGTQWSTNDMLYQDTEKTDEHAAHYSSIITAENSDARKTKWKNLVTEWFNKVSDQALPGVYSEGFSPVTFDTGSVGHGGYYPNGSFNFVEQHKPAAKKRAAAPSSSAAWTNKYATQADAANAAAGADKYSAYFSTNASERSDIQVAMRRKFGLDKEATMVEVQGGKAVGMNYMVVRQPKYWELNSHHMQFVQTPADGTLLWVNNRAWQKNQTDKEAGLTHFMQLMYGTSDEYMAARYGKGDGVPIFTSTKQAKAMKDWMAAHAGDAHPFDDRMTSEITEANAAYNTASEILTGFRLGENDQFGQMWGIWPDKSGFMNADQTIWGQGNGVDNLVAKFENNVEVALTKSNGA